jgi:hypothetical protein
VKFKIKIDELGTILSELKPLPLELLKKLRGFSPQSELYRLSDRRLSAKLVPTSADIGSHVVSATNLHGR